MSAFASSLLKAASPLPANFAHTTVLPVGIGINENFAARVPPKFCQK